MAKAGAKKRLEENAKRLTLLRTVVAVASALYLIITFGVYHKYSSSLAWLGLLATSAAYAFAYGALSAFARPVHDESGALVDGGGDLNLGGVTSYYHDLIYLTAAVQLGSLITRHAWWLITVIPLFALYQVWVNVLQPYVCAPRIQDSGGQQETAVERKKREKQERKSNRVRSR
ncbi:hypothetical protein WJX81_001121 [Elliptochloris bilobata]|uniref:Transmembrane protein 208 n=1 Tax=Elliptochloris bilobata TaxID=381761 RepID=A0AAW1R9Z5_9CHLO